MSDQLMFETGEYVVVNPRSHWIRNATELGFVEGEITARESPYRDMGPDYWYDMHNYSPRYFKAFHYRLKDILPVN